MRTFTAGELFVAAEAHETRIDDPANTDDSKWLQRRADRLRLVAEAKRAAMELKRRERRGRL